MQHQEPDDTKIALWKNCTVAHMIEERSVPLFDIKDGQVTLIPYGRNESHRFSHAWD